MTKVIYWQYLDGWTYLIPLIRKDPNRAWEKSGEPRWFCWVYPDNDQEFEVWFKENIKSGEASHRFNGGNPMYTVTILDKNDAEVFANKFDLKPV